MLYVDEEIYKKARNIVQNLIRKKRKAYVEEKPKKTTKNLIKTLEKNLKIRSVRQKMTCY